jgi:hypothetical protein
MGAGASSNSNLPNSPQNATSFLCPSLFLSPSLVWITGMDEAAKATKGQDAAL